MRILQLAEIEIGAGFERARNVAGASFERGGLRYDWVTTYSEETRSQAQKLCWDLRASGRKALLVCHSNGNLTVWQGPLSSS